MKINFKMNFSWLVFEVENMFMIFNPKFNQGKKKIKYNKTDF